MISVLKKLKLYSLTENTQVYKELQSYGTALDALTSEIQNCEKEAFVQTATSYGLEIPEREWNNMCYSTLPDETRRNMLVARYLMRYYDCMPSSLDNFFTAISFAGTYIEDAQKFTLFINNKKTQYTKTQRDLITQQLTDFIPTHLRLIIDFRTIDWNDTDAMQLDFNTMDSKSFSWLNIENYSI